MLHERHERDELRREEQRARDHEGDRRVEAVIGAAADEEELGDRRAARENRKGRQVAGARGSVREGDPGCEHRSEP